MDVTVIAALLVEQGDHDAKTCFFKVSFYITTAPKKQLQVLSPLIHMPHILLQNYSEKREEKNVCLSNISKQSLRWWDNSPAHNIFFSVIFVIG